jgi:hypothetical protein
MREVDFTNLALQVFDAAGKRETEIKLTGSSRKWKEAGSHEEIRLDSVDYLTPAGEAGPEYALLVFHWFSAAGSSVVSGNAHLLRLSGGRLRVVQKLQWDPQFESAQKHSLDREKRTMVVRSAHYLPGDAHCCVSAMDVVVLQWTGSSFRETSRRVELTDYGARQGRTLERR